MNFRFEIVNDPAPKLEGLETTVGLLYAIKFGPTVVGWVARNKDYQWVAWNSHGAFWVSYGKNRLETAQKMYNAPWHEFIRLKTTEV